MSEFRRVSGLPELPRRCAIAVSGVPRGDVISVTHSSWYISRSGLAAMLQAQPLILNDFAANAWAISGEGRGRRIEALSGPAVRPDQPGTYCIIGVGSGLGVAMLARDEYDSVSVIPTEAGHTDFLAGLPDSDAVFEILGSQGGFVTAEMVISRPGVIAVYQALAKIAGVDPLAADLAELMRLSTTSDPVVTKALAFVTRALWHFAGNLVLAYGAWDGVILTGSVTAALRSVLRRSDLARHFLLEGPFAKRLRDVPRSTVTFEHAELEGAAVALLMEDRRRGVIRG